jgi:RHS repeat-associated protein
LPGTGGTVSFAYDPFSRRIKKVSSAGTSIYAYDDDNLVEETNSSGAVVARYSQGLNIDEPLAMLRSSATSYYQADGLGSVTSLSNGAGSLAQTYGYDSFGKQTSPSGSLTNPFQYTAREFDSETMLYYMRARYFDAGTGRFISEDPVQFDSGINFYEYVRNNPLIGVDPWGLSTLVFDRATGKLYVFDKDNNFLFECTAGNRTVRSSKGPWPDGTYPYGYHNDHPADPNGPFGLYGIYVFRVPGRPGMGVHSGRANRKGPNSPTEGCVRTDDDCMKKIHDLTAKDPLKSIVVE